MAERIALADRIRARGVTNRSASLNPSEPFCLEGKPQHHLVNGYAVTHLEGNLWHAEVLGAGRLSWIHKELKKLEPNNALINEIPE